MTLTSRFQMVPEHSTSALVLHNKVPGDPLPTDDFQTQLDKRYGFSLVDLESLFVKLQITEADPGTLRRNRLRRGRTS